MKQRHSKLNRIAAAALAIGALAAAVPATSYAGGGAQIAPASQGGGGTGGP